MTSIKLRGVGRHTNAGKEDLRSLAGLYVARAVRHVLRPALDKLDPPCRREGAFLDGQPEPAMFAYLGDPQLWFESFQNWQSEFLSTAVLIVLGIFLRERLSPESEGVGEPNAKTGT